MPPTTDLATTPDPAAALAPARRAVLLDDATTFALLGVGVVLAGVLALLGGLGRPGEPMAQLLGIAAAALLVAPAAFTAFKRGGRGQVAPRAFVVHVAASVLALALATGHVAGGNLVSMPGLVYVGLLILVIQGALIRYATAQALAARFASRVHALAAPDGSVCAPEVAATPATRLPSDDLSGASRRTALRAIVDAKRALLLRIDVDADEALFSPQPRHWLRHPLWTARYCALCEQEARLVGTRDAASVRLLLWRRVHVALAALVLAGVCVHAVIALFFAGWVAGDGDAYWWHLAAVST